VGKCGRASQAKDDNTVRRMRLACWITKATDTHLEYVIFITFPRQKRIAMLTRLNLTFILALLVLLWIYVYKFPVYWAETCC